MLRLAGYDGFAIRGRLLVVAAICAAFAYCATALAASQSSVVGSGTGHFAETGGPFSLSVNGRGEGAAAKGYAFDAAAGICTDLRLNPAWTALESGDFTVRDAG